ncbi:MAG: hypothetical protein H7A24_17040 [Leptospiraceae bacterium]|nr:hypothetical protein [Leptospiraceae bacterium]MCP5513597.1 hypothetical protein [Leptospiraceae bacterium]
MSSDYIYVQNAAKISNLSKRIINWIFDKQQKAEQTFKIGGIFPETFITLDDVQHLINESDSLTEGERKESAFNESLEEFLDIKNDGRETIVYLYPIFQIISGKIKCKIALIAPNSNTQVPKDPYRRACFDYSTKVINTIFDSIPVNVYGLKSKTYVTGKRFTRKLENGELMVNASHPTVENYFGELIKRAFAPYKEHEIKDFLEDVIKFAKSKRDAFEVLPGFHLTNTPSGNDLELHLKEYFYGLELYLFHMAKTVSLENINSAIVSYKNKFAANNKDVPSSEQVQELSQINSEMILLPELSKNSNACSQMMQIITELRGRLDKQKEEEEKEWVEKQYKELEKKISEFSKNNSTMFYLNLDEYVGKIEADAKPEQIAELKKKIKENVFVKFASHNLNQEGSFAVLTADPGYLIKVVYTLKLQSLTNPKFQDQYEVAKTLYGQYESMRSITLDAKLTPEEREEYKRKLKELESGKKESTEPSFEFNQQAAVLSGTGVAMIAGGAFMFTEQFDYILFGGVASFVVGAIVGFIFRKKNGPVDTGKDLKSSKPVSTLLKVAEEIVYKGSTTIGDQLRTKDSLEKIASKNVDLFRKRYEPFAKEKSDEKIITSVVKILSSNCVTIRVPKENVPDGKPSTIYIKKGDFKSKVFRENVVKYLQEESSLKKKGLNEKYYGFLIHAVEIDYARYLKSGG